MRIESKGGSFAWVASLGLALLAGAAGAQGLPTTMQQAEQMDHADELPMTSFYATPARWRHTRPGALLRQETFSGYSLPRGTTTVRILYRSVDGAGRGVVTSGVVLIPAGKVPAGGWPVIAWAHGTSGVARACAPSLMKDVYYGNEGLSDMLRAGYAIVATDYHGLGTEGAHQYVDLDAQARDVIYSVPAAQRAVPSLGARWVVDGHSQGGATAWRVATLESSIDDPHYLGAVSVSGSASMRDLVEHMDRSQGGQFYLTYIAFGIHARYPRFEPSDILTPRALAGYHGATTQGCWTIGYFLYSKGPHDPMLRPGWQKNPWVRRFLRQAREGTRRLRKPILVLAGEADRTVPFAGERRVAARACRAGSVVEFKAYPGLDHDPTMVKSVPDQLHWIGDRFAGKTPASNCGSL